ncbi:MAG: hypothetical protein ACK56I_29870, partial [bacterium]
EAPGEADLGAGGEVPDPQHALRRDADLAQQGAGGRVVALEISLKSGLGGGEAQRDLGLAASGQRGAARGAQVVGDHDEMLGPGAQGDERVGDEQALGADLDALVDDLGPDRDLAGPALAGL